MLINKCESLGSNNCNGFAAAKAFTEYSNDMDDIYQNIDEYHPNKNAKYCLCLMVDDMSVDMRSNKKLNSLVTELFIRKRKLNISHVFIKQS